MPLPTQKIDLARLLFDSLGLPENAFQAKTAVITGAGQGIGKEIARAFALLGGCVVIAELNERGKEVEEEIRRGGGQALYVQTDVSSTSDVQRLQEITRQAFGPVEVLVNNAIRSPVSPVIDMDLAAWDGVIAVNLRGTFLTCRAFLPEMLAQGHGTILNMVSTDAMPGLSAYIASKQGITGFSQSLALEVGTAGVRVIPFAPGMVDTPGIRGVSQKLAPHLGLSQEQFLNISLHAAYDGLMPAEHAGAAAVYLALRLAEEYHGQVVNGYEVLERAGLLKSLPPITTTDGSIAQQPAAADRRAEITRLSLKLQAILDETAREFEKLPVFVRPIARNGFKNKAGASLNDWQRTFAQIASTGNIQDHDLLPRLEKLVKYFEGVPGETARFTRDPELLREVAAVCQARIDTIRAFTCLLA